MEKVIFWNVFCGNETAHDAFWDSNMTINAETPDFTVCFQRSILVWLPSFFLWLISLAYLPFLLSKKVYHKPWKTSKFNLLKLGTIAVLLITSVVELSWFIFSASYLPIYPVHYTSSFIRFSAFLLAGVLTHMTYRRAIHSSGILFIYWFLQTVCSIFIFRSLFLRDEEKFLQSITTVNFCLSVISFAYCFFSDLLPDVIFQKIHQVPPYESYVTDAYDDVTDAKNVLIENGVKSGQDTIDLVNIKAYGDQKGPTKHLLTNKKDQKDDMPLNPKLKAPFFSVLLFFWFLPTIFKGWRKTLENSDIFKLRVEDSGAAINPAFLQNWNDVIKETKAKNRRRQERGKPPLNPSLSTALWRTFKTPFVTAGLLTLVYDFILFFNPYLLNKLLAFVRTRDGLQWHGYVFCVCMFLSSVASVLSLNHAFNLLYTVGMRVRTALTAVIYRKALTVNAKERQTSTVGEIVNMMSVDTQKMGDSLNLIHYVWSSPLILVIAIIALWQIIGPSTMAGIGFLLIVLPINSMVLAKMIRSFHSVQMLLKDSRLKLMNQILTGIRILKLYAWEAYFVQKILEIRQKELINLRKSQAAGAITYVMWFLSSFIVALLCFTTFVLVSPTNILDPTTAFVSLSLIMLMNFPLTILPPAIMLLVQAIVSMKRVEKFLLKEDIDPLAVTHSHDPDHAVSIKDGDFAWNDESTTLEGINFDVKHKQLVGVVGLVGCGKSSLLSAILGEINKLKGSVNVDGKVAYVGQQAWIQNLTLRDNILFDMPYDSSKYQQIIKACALQSDIDILMHGDQTEIGERGINLSGGQKQRISLARAVYHNADIYLLDDTLSAVDAHVSKHIFNRVLSAEGLLKNKTRILVTHNISLLPKMDRVVVIEDGKIREEGSFEELIQKDGKFAEFLRTHLMNREEEQEGEDDETIKEIQKKVFTKSISTVESETKSVSIHHSGTTESPTSLNKSSQQVLEASQLRRRKDSERVSSQKSLEKNQVTAKLMQEEISQEGAIKLSVLRAYVGAAPIMYPIILIISAILFVVAYVSTNIWLSAWSMDPVYNGTQDRDQTKYRIEIYAVLGVFQTVSMVGVIYAIVFGCLEASKNLHSKLLNNVIRSPMHFFDTVPVGRVLNRFSKDVDILDSNIPQFSQNLTTTLCPLIGVIVIISYTTAYFILVVIPLMVFFVFLQRVYVACARQIKRVDSVKKSPVYAFFSESLAGTPTIRAYRQQKRFIINSDRLMDESQRVWFEVFSSNRWMGVWSEFIADIMILFTAFFAVMQRDNIDPSLIGLALSFAFQINVNIIMVVRSSCELETYIVAAERIQEYTEIENESPWYLDDNRVPEGWPDQGKVSFNDYSTRYRPGLDLVLKDINVDIKPEEKVGIVGRTGAGKSSMTLALFRMVEAAAGSISIDGIKLSDIGLHDVRKNITVIPQDPVLFSGSLRFNLDPADLCTDEQIWTALEQAHLKSYIQTLPDKLNSDCGEDGSNLSVGQRQLLCLARALLRRSKVLVLDEATAAIDMETDSLIQSTIRQQFDKCTVLTIAHRINTILDYDRILVLDKGTVKEFDTPGDLMKNEKSMFYSLVKSSGL